MVSIYSDCGRFIIYRPFRRCSRITVLSTNRHTCPCTRPPWPHRANILALHTLPLLPCVAEIECQQLILVDFVVDQRIFWFRHDFARLVHVTRAVPFVVFLLLSGPRWGGGGLGKGKVGVFVTRAATKGSLHLLAEWHDEGGNDWNVDCVKVNAKAGKSASERMAGLRIKWRLVDSISQIDEKKETDLQSSGGEENMTSKNLPLQNADKTPLSKLKLRSLINFGLPS